MNLHLHQACVHILNQLSTLVDQINEVDFARPVESLSNSFYVFSTVTKVASSTTTNAPMINLLKVTNSLRCRRSERSLISLKAYRTSR
jgi:hypothetical protein